MGLFNLFGQIERYGLATTVLELAKECEEEAGRWVDKDRKLFWRDGEATFSFGKYRGQSIRNVLNKDIGYIRWLAEGNFGVEFRAIINKARRGEFPEKKKQLTGVTQS